MARLWLALVLLSSPNFFEVRENTILVPGLGYEFGSNTGLHLQVAPYVMVTPATTAPWAGLSVGTTF